MRNLIWTKGKLSGIAVGLVGLMLAWQVAAQSLPDLQAMKALILSGQAQAAYEQLTPHILEQAGDADFDYILGLAALQSGHPDEATLAFERALAVRPDMLGARLDMARAYFELGNHDLAKQEFEELQKLEPPAEAEKVMQKYLQSIKSTSSPSAWTAFVEATIGHDSNVNDAGDANVFIPVFGGTVTLDSASVESPDEFAQFRVVARGTHKINLAMSAYGSLDLKTRSHTTTNSFNTRQGAFAGGLQTTRGKHTLKAGVNFIRSTLDGSDYRDVVGVTGEWAFALDPKNTIGAFVQRNEIRYQDDSDASEDSDLSLLGLSWTTATDTFGDTLISASVFAGYDKALEDRLDGSRKIAGARVAVQHKLNARTRLYASAGLQQSHYKQENSLFLDKRDDEQWDATLGVNWQYRKKWVINPYISYVQNDSNIEIDEFDSTEVGLTVRRQLH